MTVDLSGITGVQARIASLQAQLASLSGARPPVDPSLSTTASFESSLAKATQGTTLGGILNSNSTTGVSQSTALPQAGVTNSASLLAAANKYLGVPYKWGGTDPAVGLDCSGFVQRAYKDIGISLPRVAADQAREGTPVASIAQAQPGDLVAFGSPVDHIGIYVGDNKMIVAPHTGDVVKIQTISRPVTAIRRILPESAAITGVAANPVAANSSAAILSSFLANNVAGAGTSGYGGVSGLGGLSGYSAASGLYGASGLAAANGLSGAYGTTSVSGASTGYGIGGYGATVNAPSGSALAAAPAAYQALFQSAAAKYGVKAELLAAVAKAESGFDSGAVSSAGAIGLMQIMPGTARSLGVNPRDPAQAVDGAARLLRDGLTTFKSTELALAAYNAGAGAVQRYGGVPPYAETTSYVRKIMADPGVRAA